jgi:hypothetical protein
VPHAPYPVHPRALAVVREQRIPQQHAQRQRVARAVEVDLSSGTQPVLTGHSSGTQEVLKSTQGYASGTQAALQGYSRGFTTISRAARRRCALYLPFECGARPLLVGAVAADVYLRRRGVPFGGWGLGRELSLGLWAQGLSLNA